MFVKYDLLDIKKGKISLDKNIQNKDLMLILQSFKNENIDLTDWKLFEIAKSGKSRVYGMENLNDLVYMKVNITDEVLPCYFKNHGLNGYSEFVAKSINEAMKLYEKTYEPKEIPLDV